MPETNLEKLTRAVHSFFPKFPYLRPDILEFHADQAGISQPVVTWSETFEPLSVTGVTSEEIDTLLTYLGLPLEVIAPVPPQRSVHRARVVVDKNGREHLVYQATSQAISENDYQNLVNQGRLIP